MAVQTNFRAVDMPGAVKAAEVVVEKKAAPAPKAKAPKAAPVVVEETVAPVVEDVVEEVAAPTEE
jgi:hypothetical protein